MTESKRIVFLYSELANYFLVCLKHFQKLTNSKIIVIHWPINKEAPFELDLKINDVVFYDKSKLENSKLVSIVANHNPQLIYCSGWIDKEYLKICKAYKKIIPVVSGLDTQWNGNIKQYLHSFLSPFTIKRAFSHLWIAGPPQLKYAKKLGFSDDKILNGVYSADTPFFETVYHQNKSKKEINPPKRFVFVGRYLEFKGIFDLWQAFIHTFKHQDHEWELWCLGTGDLWEKRMNHPKIKHLGFVQPSQMNVVLEQTSVFVLPSHFEPWAVSLHEFVSAGFPIIASNKVGSTAVFLKDGKNGFIFESGNVDALTQCFLKFINMPTTQLNEFANQSFSSSKSMTPNSWSATLASLL